MKTSFFKYLIISFYLTNILDFFKYIFLLSPIKIIKNYIFYLTKLCLKLTISL